MAQGTTGRTAASQSTQERRELLSFVARAVTASEVRIAHGSWVPLDFAGVRSRLDDGDRRQRSA